MENKGLAKLLNVLDYLAFKRYRAIEEDENYCWYFFGWDKIRGVIIDQFS